MLTSHTQSESMESITESETDSNPILTEVLILAGMLFKLPFLGEKQTVFAKKTGLMKQTFPLAFIFSIKHIQVQEK